MGPNVIEIEVERREEEIRADKAQNVKGYFESKKRNELYADRSQDDEASLVAQA